MHNLRDALAGNAKLSRQIAHELARCVSLANFFVPSHSYGPGHAAKDRISGEKVVQELNCCLLNEEA
jgi:hypothetical protein